MPKNPYFHELKGQILFENGHAKKALLSLEKAVELLPRNSLFRALLGRVQLELNNLKLLPKAITNFQVSLEKEPQRAFIWKQLGITFGRLNMIGKSSRALAESALLKGLSKDAIRLAKKAKKYLKWLGDVAKTMKRSLKDKGQLFLNMGYSNSDPFVAMDVAQVFSQLLVKTVEFLLVVVLKLLGLLLSLDCSRLDPFIAFLLG